MFSAYPLILAVLLGVMAWFWSRSGHRTAATVAVVLAVLFFLPWAFNLFGQGGSGAGAL